MSCAFFSYFVFIHVRVCERKTRQSTCALHIRAAGALIRKELLFVFFFGPSFISLFLPCLGFPTFALFRSPLEARLFSKLAEKYHFFSQPVLRFAFCEFTYKMFLSISEAVLLSLEQVVAYLIVPRSPFVSHEWYVTMFSASKYSCRWHRVFSGSPPVCAAWQQYLGGSPGIGAPTRKKICPRWRLVSFTRLCGPSFSPSPFSNVLQDGAVSERTFHSRAFFSRMWRNDAKDDRGGVEKESVITCVVPPVVSWHPLFCSSYSQAVSRKVHVINKGCASGTSKGNPEDRTGTTEERKLGDWASKTRVHNLTAGSNARTTPCHGKSNKRLR